MSSEQLYLSEKSVSLHLRGILASSQWNTTIDPEAIDRYSKDRVSERVLMNWTFSMWVKRLFVLRLSTLAPSKCRRHPRTVQISSQSIQSE